MFRIALIVVLVICIVGCLPTLDAPPTAIVTATPDTLDILTGNSTTPTLPPLAVARQVTPDSATPVLSSPVPTEVPQRCDDLPPDANTRPRYTLDATLNWEAHQAEVEEQVTFTNITPVVLDRLAFHVEANYQPGFLDIHDVLDEKGEEIENFSIEVTRLTIPLPNPLAPNCTTTVSILYTLRLAPVLDGYFGRVGYLGFTERQINLGHWMPVLGQYSDDWYTPQPYFIGEHTFTASSDFDVTLTVTDAPPTIDVAAPGIMRVLGVNQWQYTLEGSRDFSISVGNGFRRISELAEDGTVVELYYYPNNNSAGLNAAGHSIQTAVDALKLYTELFGINYPYKRMVIVEGDFPDGMEFTGLVFVSEAWFRTWRGEVNEWLTVITVHEIAHQWWYALVGNDPTLYPYLDEAFATYSEYLFFQRYYGDRTEWWWDFRVRGYPVDESLVDGDVYRYDNARPYIDGSYLRGAQMLEVMRTDLGDTAFFTWLQTYASANQYRIATPLDLWGALTPEQYAASEPIRQRFFGKWGVLPEATLESSETVEQP